MNTEPLLLSVYPAEHFRVTNGVAMDEQVLWADQLIMDDVYRLDVDAAEITLEVDVDPADDKLRIAGSDVELQLDSCLAFMTPDGKTNEVIVLIAQADSEDQLFLLALDAIEPGVDYRLVHFERRDVAQKLAMAACGSFAGGTKITMADGSTRAIETLQIGDTVLTRDDGVQPIRWIVKNTVRAQGSYAPVQIKARALHNDADLLVRPDHRLLVYQRKDEIGAGRAQVLVKAKHLINNDTVIQLEGGYVDYYHLMFDEHYLIFACGIAAESQLNNNHTRFAMPDAPLHGHRPHMDYEPGEAVLGGRDLAKMLYHASAPRNQGVVATKSPSKANMSD